MFLCVLWLFVLSVPIEFHSFSFIISSEELRIRKIKLDSTSVNLHLSPLFCPKSDKILVSVLTRNITNWQRSCVFQQSTSAQLHFASAR